MLFRSAHVVAIDLSPTLVELARERLRGQLPVDLLGGKLEFVSGDMLSTTYGQFDHVIAMDSMIHYEKHDMVYGLAGLSAPRIPCCSLLRPAIRFWQR